MISQNYTIATRLQKSDITYFENFITEYNKVYRKMWYIMTSPDYDKQYKKDSYFVTDMCNRYGMLKRTINSIRYDIKGKMKALQELKKTELKQLGIKIQKKEDKVADLIKYINNVKPLVRDNKATDKQLKKYRRSKQSLYHQKNRLNKMKQKREVLESQIKNNVLNIGFGKKRVFDNQYRPMENGFKSHQGWYNDYIKHRDKNIFYLGSSDETCGNQLFQLVYNPDNDDFSAKIRKEKSYCRSNKNKDKYMIIGHIDFKYQKNKIIEILKEGKQPLSYRIHRENNKWYLQCLFDIRYDRAEYITRSKYGVLGLDYNDGFIEISETDECGNLIGQYHYDLYEHGTGTKAENEIRQAVCNIVKTAERKGKDIVIEDLDFKTAKAKTDKAKGKSGKQYNKMIHLFDYSRYKDTLRNCCHRHKVLLQMVNPKNTSKTGRQKYSDRMKLNVHQAASFVIARKGQGFKDKLIKKGI